MNKCEKQEQCSLKHIRINLLNDVGNNRDISDSNVGVQISGLPASYGQSHTVRLINVFLLVSVAFVFSLSEVRRLDPCMILFENCIFFPQRY